MTLFKMPMPHTEPGVYVRLVRNGRGRLRLHAKRLAARVSNGVILTPTDFAYADPAPVSVVCDDVMGSRGPSETLLIWHRFQEVTKLRRRVFVVVGATAQLNVRLVELDHYTNDLMRNTPAGYGSYVRRRWYRDGELWVLVDFKKVKPIEEGVELCESTV